MMDAITAAPFEVRIGDAVYSGWKNLRVTRDLECAASDFEMSVSERWPILDEPESWRILPGLACDIYCDGELVLTGWTEGYKPNVSAGSHEVSVTGRSKTCDFVDSSIVVGDGQFKGMTPAALARLLAQPFDIEVLAHFEGEPIKDTQAQQGEKAFALVERLAKLQELLITDDAEGRLVLTRAALGQCSSILEYGRNILSCAATHDDSERFSHYIVKAQRPANRTYDDYGETGAPLAAVAAAGGPEAWSRLRVGQRFALTRKKGKKATKPKTLTQITDTVRDPGITRYRPHVIVAEAQADDADAAKRADWEMRRRLAKAKEATVTVTGWRQRDGRLWQVNENVFVQAPPLDLAEPLLIRKVQFSYGGEGALAELDLCLPDALLPDPKRKTKSDAQKAKGKGGGGGAWDHLIKDSGKI